MLSIRLDAEREWWVSGEVWDRLFASALTSGVMARELEQLRDVGHANGGMDLDLLELSEARALVAGLRTAAEQELNRTGEPDSATIDGTYQASLRKLLALIS